MPESHQLTFMTYDLIDYHGRIEDASVHTILFKPSHQAVSRLLKQRLQGRLTAIVRVKCTPQPEHIAEAVYLNHRKHIKSIHAVDYIGEAATRQGIQPVQGRYEEYRLLAVTYSTDKAYDTTFTINQHIATRTTRPSQSWQATRRPWPGRASTHEPSRTSRSSWQPALSIALTSTYPSRI